MKNSKITLPHHTRTLLSPLLKSISKYSGLSLAAFLSFGHSTVLANDLEVSRQQNEPIIFILPTTQKQPASRTNQDPPFKLPPGTIYKDDAEALETDMGLISKQAGIPLDKVRSSIAFQDAFYQYADKVRARYPNQITGVWVEPVPAQSGGIRFIGKVPTALLSETKKRGQDNQVRLMGGGKVLEQDHADYTRIAVEALQDMELDNFICEYNVSTDRIDIEIYTPDKASIPDQSDILESIQNRVNNSRFMEKGMANFPADIKIDVKITNSSVMVPTNHKGGMTGFEDHPEDGWVYRCTTAWSAFDPLTNKDGIVTAGHCSIGVGGMNGYGELTSLPSHFMTRKQVWFSFNTQDAAFYTNSYYSVGGSFFLCG